jgi:BirA family biotin operon repressor/biotin-[acetyl-CoA-carboxylase] ligase
VLTEMEGEADRVSWLVAGVGVNANVEAAALPPGATSLREQVGTVDRRLFTQRLLERFDGLRTTPGKIPDAWRERAATLGHAVRVETPEETVAGEAVGITASGGLAVETDGGRRVVYAGDCEHLRRS